MWGPGWEWFGSYLDLDNERPVLKTCSAECKEVYRTDHGRLPDVAEETQPVKAALEPSAFQVTCPCCETAIEVTGWDTGPDGSYVPAVIDPNELPFPVCKTCGTMIEPTAIRVLPF